jgi:hypothetical protein
MQVKRKLGIDTFPVDEEEVVEKISHAYDNKEDTLVLSSGNCVVKIEMEKVCEDINADEE